MSKIKPGSRAVLKRDVPACGGKKGDYVTVYNPIFPRKGYIAIEHPSKPSPRILIPEKDVAPFETECGSECQKYDAKFDNVNIFDGGDWWDHYGREEDGKWKESEKKCETKKPRTPDGFFVVHEDCSGEPYAYRKSSVIGFGDGVIFLSDGTEFDCKESLEEISDAISAGRGA